MTLNREGIVGTYEITQSWPGIVFSTHVTGGKSQERMKIRDSRDSMRERERLGRRRKGTEKRFEGSNGWKRRKTAAARSPQYGI